MKLEGTPVFLMVRSPIITHPLYLRSSSWFPIGCWPLTLWVIISLSLKVVLCGLEAVAAAVKVSSCVATVRAYLYLLKVIILYGNAFMVLSFVYNRLCIHSVTKVSTCLLVYQLRVPFYWYVVN